MSKDIREQIDRIKNLNRILKEEDSNIEEMPNFSKKGKKIVSDENIELKLYNSPELEKNIALYIEAEGNMFMSKGWFIAYFTLIEDYAKTMTPTSGWLFFPPRIGFKSSPINDIWKGVKNAGGEANKIVAACQGWVDNDKKEVYMNMLSVKPGYKRNAVATKLIDNLKNNWKGYNFTVSKTTKDGSAFLDQRSDSNEFKRDTKDFPSLFQ